MERTSGVIDERCGYGSSAATACGAAADLRPSPMFDPEPGGEPPAMLVIAGFDPLRDEGRANAGRLRATGVDVVCREDPGQIHVFVSLTKAIPHGLARTLA